MINGMSFLIAGASFDAARFAGAARTAGFPGEHVELSGEGELPLALLEPSAQDFLQRAAMGGGPLCAWISEVHELPNALESMRDFAHGLPPADDATDPDFVGAFLERLLRDLPDPRAYSEAPVHRVLQVFVCPESRSTSPLSVQAVALLKQIGASAFVGRQGFALASSDLQQDI